MYSKTRNTLIALIAASLFATTGVMFGQPIPTPAQSQPSMDLQATIVDADLQDAITAHAMSVRPANHMSLAMPYFSFSLQLPQRRAD
ncbi:MAG: hypothetical protein ABI365_06005 [Lysobacteraceae bacterium]